MIFNWLEWVGYLASAIIAVSLLMSSLVKLRWLNLVGSILFAAYGFMINALPVGLINTIIVFINVYYLYKIYTFKEYFKIVEITQKSEYLNSFFNFYKDDIKKFFSKFNFEIEKAPVRFYILRNMVVAGVFIASEYGKESLFIDLDFVIPEYRDFKIGTFIFEHDEQYFLEKGYKHLISYASNRKHNSYLKRMGFREMELDGNILLVRNIGKSR